MNNSCFETEALMHYEKTGKVYTDCDAVGNSIVKHLNDHSKYQEYLRK